MTQQLLEKQHLPTNPRQIRTSLKVRQLLHPPPEHVDHLVQSPRHPLEPLDRVPHRLHLSQPRPQLANRLLRGRLGLPLRSLLRSTRRATAVHLADPLPSQRPQPARVAGAVVRGAALMGLAAPLAGHGLLGGCHRCSSSAVISTYRWGTASQRWRRSCSVSASPSTSMTGVRRVS